MKNDRLGLTIPYRCRGLLSRYIPDFIVVTDGEENVLVEIKGQITDDADAKAKAKAAERWVKAVNRLSDHGIWRYLLVEDPGKFGIQLNGLAAVGGTRNRFSYHRHQRGAGGSGRKGL